MSGEAMLLKNFFITNSLVVFEARKEGKKNEKKRREKRKENEEKCKERKV